MEKNNLRLIIDNTKSDATDSIDSEVPLLDAKAELKGNERRNGWIGAAAVAATVATWDFSNNETITSFVERGVKHENKFVKASTVASVGYVALHLLDMIPTKYDVFDGLARLGKRVRTSQD